MSKRRKSKQKPDKLGKARPGHLFCAFCLTVEEGSVRGNYAISIIEGNALCGECLLRLRKHEEEQNTNKKEGGIIGTKTDKDSKN